MSNFDRISGSLVLLTLVAALSGCGGGEEKAEAKPSAPWKWEPDDAELETGKQVYTRTCSLCHNEGEESAPRLTNSATWTERATKGEETLIKHAIEGFKGDRGTMPPRGDNADLTDEEVAAAVKFMIAAPK